jgi:WD40 repeat protein
MPPTTSIDVPGRSSLKLTNTNLIECGLNRTSCRSVSWSTDGAYLAMASSDRVVRLWTIEASGASREVLVVSGHTGPVTKTRFHPMEATSLCTVAQDLTVRLWDVRSATQKSTGIIDLEAHAVSAEWSPKVAISGGALTSSSSLLAVTDRNGAVLIYDVRKLAAPTAARGHAPVTPALHTFLLAPHFPEQCVFSPQGRHLTAGTCCNGEGAGEFRIWAWDQPPFAEQHTTTYQAHCGPIYALQYSPNGQRLASGGSDATAGLWDVDSMCCITSLASRTKLISHVAFSSDNLLLAICSADDGVDLVEALTGASVGMLNLSHRPRSGGAEEIAWHPKADYLLACARCAPSGNLLPVAPVTVAKLSISGNASQ